MPVLSMTWFVAQMPMGQVFPLEVRAPRGPTRACREFVAPLSRHLCPPAAARVPTRGGPARAGRNPRTGAHVPVDQKSVPFFKTGKEMRERLNRDHPDPGAPD